MAAHAERGWDHPVPVDRQALSLSTVRMTSRSLRLCLSASSLCPRLSVDVSLSVSPSRRLCLSVAVAVSLSLSLSRSRSLSGSLSHALTLSLSVSASPPPPPPPPPSSTHTRRTYFKVNPRTAVVRSFARWRNCKHCRTRSLPDPPEFSYPISIAGSPGRQQTPGRTPPATRAPSFGYIPG